MRHVVRRTGAAPSSAGRLVVGGFFLVMGGVHLGLVTADPQVYEHFADDGLFPFVREGWQGIVMQNPAVWGLLLMAGEIAFGALLLAGDRTARLGWYAVLAFHVLLMLFGFGAWVWSLPAIVVLVLLARRDPVFRPTSSPSVPKGQPWRPTSRAGPSSSASTGPSTATAPSSGRPARRPRSADPWSSCTPRSHRRPGRVGATRSARSRAPS